MSVKMTRSEFEREFDAFDSWYAEVVTGYSSLVALKDPLFQVPACHANMSEQCEQIANELWDAEKLLRKLFCQCNKIVKGYKKTLETFDDDRDRM